MEKTKKIVLRFILLFCFCSVAYANTTTRHEIGGAYGWGKPESLRGFRVDYRYHLFRHAAFYMDIEVSHGRWQLNSHYQDKVNTTGIAPVFRMIQSPNYRFRFYLEGSVGPSRISTKILGGKRFGSKWNFQDIIGGGVIYQDWDLRVHYLHYSNAKISMPNPGIDILPLVTLSYRF